MNASPKQSSETLLQACKPEHFQGRTQFARMSPAQRLEWLDQALDFLRQAKRATHIPGKLL